MPASCRTCGLPPDRPDDGFLPAARGVVIPPRRKMR